MKALPLYKDPPFAPVETSAFLERDGECDRCDLHKEARHHICIPADDGTDEGEVFTNQGGVLVVGEGPAREDDSEGRPLADRMGGAYLRSLVDQHYQGHVSYDLGTRCWNGKLILEEDYFDRCRPYLANTVARVEPSRVIALGAWGAYAVTGRKIRNSTCRRGYGWLYEYDAPVYFLSSPHEVRGNRFLREQFESDLEWALTAPIPKAPPFKSIVNIVETYEDALIAARDLEQYPWVTFDCETSGPLFDATFTLLCVALCGKGANDTWLWGRAALNDPRIAKVLARIMTNPKIKKGGQNIKFDILAIWCGLHVWCAPTVYDTRLQRKLIFAEADAKLETMAELIGMGGHKLEAQDALKLAVKELRKASTTPDEERPALDRLPAMVEAVIRLNDTSGDTLKKWAYALIPDDILYRYNARDTLSTDRLAIHLEEELEEEPELEHHWEIGVRRAINAFARIEANGIAISEDGVHAFNKLLKHQIDEATVKIYAYGEFNPNSTPQIREILFKKLRLRPVKKTKGTKQPSTDAASLEVLSKQHAFPGDLLVYRKLCKLKSVYAEPMITFIRADGRVHPTFNLDGARSGRGSCNEPNCFDGQTELLTNTGWIRFDELICSTGWPTKRKDVSVAQWSNGVISFVPPTGVIAKRNNDTLVHISNQHIDLMATPDHRCLLRHRKTGELRVFRAADYPEDWQQLNAGDYDGPGTLKMSDAMLTLLCATQADGNWHDSGIDFSFMKARKIARLVQCLQVLGIPYSMNELDSRGRTRIRVKQSQMVAELHSLLGKDKHFGSWLLDLDRAALDFFAEEVFLWDGCATRMNHYASAVKQNADWVQIALVLTGRRANTRVYIPSETAWGSLPSHQVDVSHRDNSLTTNAEVQSTPHTGLVYCVSVPSGFIVVRRNGKVMVTGNCQNIPRAGTPMGKLSRDIFIAPDGMKLVELDYSQLELRVAAMLSGDLVMRQIFVDGHDYHQRTAELISQLKWKIDPSQVKKEHRDVAKTFNFGLLYGMTDEGMAARLKCPVEEAAMLRAAIMGKFHQLDRWIQRMLREARESGVTYTYWAGKKARRRPLYGVNSSENRLRSNAENSSYNTPVQGSAADFCLFSLCEIVEWIDREQLNAKVVLTVHDSIIIEVIDSQVKKVINGAKRIMESWPSAGKLDVPLKADVKLGQTWGSLVEIKDSSKWREALAAGEKK